MKKIAVNTVRTFLKEQKQQDVITRTFSVGESSFDVEIKTSLSIVEKTTFINRVLSGCFDNKSNFRPEYVSPMLRATIIQMCTNLPILSLKNEQADDGGSLMDLEAMDGLYVAMDLDHVDDEVYQSMLSEIVGLCGQAIDWKRSRVVSGGSTDTAIHNFVETLTAKIDGIDMEELMGYAGQLSDATKGLDEGGILKGLLQLHDKQE